MRADARVREVRGPDAEVTAAREVPRFTRRGFQPYHAAGGGAECAADHKKRAAPYGDCDAPKEGCFTAKGTRRRHGSARKGAPWWKWA
jgi:hypothetical protein